MTTAETIYVLSDNIIEVTSVTNVPTGAYLNNATVTLTLVDAASGQNIAGQTWPLSLTYVTASNGNYRGTITDSAQLVDEQVLIAKITVDGGDGLKRYWEKACIAKVGS